MTMSNYEESKKARRVASVVYIIIMGFIFIGTYLSNAEKVAAKKESNSIAVITSSENH